MAEMMVKNEASKKRVGVKKPSRNILNVDMTPMVDLGFILITFFVFTSTMTESAAMKLFLPKDVVEDKTMDVPESGALTLLIGDDNNIYYYEGMLNQQTVYQHTNFNELRDVIINKKRRTKAEDFMVIIKPTNNATMGAVVNVLDEMNINVVKRYAMVDISDTEMEGLMAMNK